MMNTLNLETDLISIDFNPFEQDRNIDKLVSINKAQQEIYLSCLMGGDEANIAYNESVSIAIKGHFELDYFKKAFDQLVQRHEALRSHISGNGEKLIIYDFIPYQIIAEDLQELSHDIKKQHIDSFLNTQMAHPFDLNEAPLFRVFIHQLEDDQVLITLILHHIICDGWSLGIILEELSKLYSSHLLGNSLVLPEAFQISQFAIAQDNYLNSAEFRSTENFWLKEFAQAAPQIDLPTDFPRANQRTYQSKRIDQLLPKNSVENLRKGGAKIGCSLVTTMLSIFEVLIFKKTRQNELVIGLPSAEQAVTAFYNLVGHCVNILPIRSTIDANLSLTDYLNAKRSHLMDVYDHQQYSFGQLLNKLNPKRDISRVPLVPIVFNIDMGMDSDVSFYGVDHQIISNVRQSETFELFVNATDTADGLTLEWNYNTQLFKAATINEMISDFKSLIDIFLENPAIKIVDAVSAGAVKAIVEGDSFVNTNSFVDLFNECAKPYSNRNALSFNGERLDYQTLHQQADALAFYLQNKGIGKGQTIAIAVERSAKMLVTMIAVLKTGAAYLPIDTNLPVERINYMLKDSGASNMVSSSTIQIDPGIKNISINEAFASIHLNINKWKNIAIDLKDPAYLLYTSGSTGFPKGVKISHGNLANLLLSTQQMPGLTDIDRLLAITTISFDIAALELFLPLICGAEVVIADSITAKDGRLINDLISLANITALQGTPSTLSMILDVGLKTNQLKVIVGGEQLDIHLAKAILSTGARLWNMYGPTETTIYSSGKEILPSDEWITIGNPVHNTQVHIMDQSLNPVYKGEVGEICIGGDGVSLGYINQEKLTDDKFVRTDPHSNLILYKTGDLGKMLPSGEILCLGRIDHQIKVRGHRIEPGEIENQLLNREEIAQTLVLQRDDINKSEVLVAYLVLNQKFKDDPNLLDVSQQHHVAKDQISISKNYLKFLKDDLAKLLPSYMLPHYIVVLEAFPITSNGKVDRALLPKPIFNPTEKSIKANGTLTPAEELLKEIWSTCLVKEDINITDDFFELGGNSLIAVSMMLALEKKIGFRMPLTTLLKYATIETLAQQLSFEVNDKKSQTIIPIRTGGDKNPVYLIHGSGLNVLLFKSIIASLNEDQPIYGVQAIGLDHDEQVPDSIEQIAARYIEELLLSNPNGPYNIVGYSLGGFIAFEMAKQLKVLGKEINLLGVVDTDTGRNVSKEESQNNLGYFIKRQFKKIPFIAASFTKTPINTLKYQLDITKKRLFKNSETKLDLDWALFSDREKGIYIKYDEALQRYLLTAANLKITLFRVSERLYFLDDLTYLGWDRFANKGVEVCEIPGDHKTFISAPHHTAFAKILQNQLNKNANA
ncbi:amino acid adenylation domain-containing protein [Pedobacter sp. Leaf250]|uniref:non-ribosomal peptide synthetase n=1 Tax=Pedobacter sp. Leaf250 TaxID=2876559 RepID=UPI001E59A9B5|nr:non-ribosomal peptide synthetase [Pedobacter sp. Leaf250]